MGQARRTHAPTEITPAAPSDAPEQQFLRLMSHEMRTPLNGVIGMLGLLSRTKLDGAQRAYAEAAQKSAEHLLGLVNDLLDFARLEAGALEFDPAPVDLEGLTRGVAELLSPKAHDKGLEIVWSVAADAPDVIADEGRLRQVLFNLAGNAVKFTPSGSITLEASYDGARLSIRICDTGPGIAPEKLDRLFKRFSQVDASSTRVHGGTGLDLVICKALVEGMKGEIGVESRLGELLAAAGKETSCVTPLPMPMAPDWAR